MAGSLPPVGPPNVRVIFNNQRFSSAFICAVCPCRLWPRCQAVHRTRPVTVVERRRRAGVGVSTRGSQQGSNTCTDRVQIYAVGYFQVLVSKRQPAAGPQGHDNAGGRRRLQGRYGIVVEDGGDLGEEAERSLNRAGRLAGSIVHGDLRAAGPNERPRQPTA